MRALAVGFALLLLVFGGCAGLFTPSPEQLKELVKVKDAAATCIKGVYAGALFTAVTASIDKGIYGGSVTMDENCKTTVNTGPFVPGIPAAVPALPVVAPPKP